MKKKGIKAWLASLHPVLKELLAGIVLTGILFEAVFVWLAKDRSVFFSRSVAGNRRFHFPDLPSLPRHRKKHGNVGKAGQRIRSWNVQFPFCSDDRCIGADLSAAFRRCGWCILRTSGSRSLLCTCVRLCAASWDIRLRILLLKSLKRKRKKKEGERVGSSGMLQGQLLAADSEVDFMVHGLYKLPFRFLGQEVYITTTHVSVASLCW